MTRRERHVRIIEAWDSRSRRWETDGVMARLGLGGFTDDAIEAIAAALVSSHRWHQRINRENRARVAAALSPPTGPATA